MATVEQVQDLILIAKGYLLELAQNIVDEWEDGCNGCALKTSLKIQQVILLSEQLQQATEQDKIDSLYACLLSAVANYSGASIAVDANSKVPSIDIDVTIVGDNRPDWIDVSWTDMTNDVTGYRDTYFNAEWVGFDPMIQIGGVVMYQRGVDYVNDGNGTIVFASGKGLYQGQFFRAGNFKSI